MAGKIRVGILFGGRYAREKSAALCYGASMYRPGKNPGVITLRRSAE
jgi:hypothetical protein